MTSEALQSSMQNRLANRLSNLKRAITLALPHARDFLVHAIGQPRILSKAYPGIMHFLIFWGVTIQVLGTAINLMQMQVLVPFVELTFPRGQAYLDYELVMDIAGAAILLGVLMAAFRRVVIRPKTLQTRWDDTYALVLLGLIPLAGFTLEATRLLSANPAWARWSPIGYGLANLFRDLGMSPGTAFLLHNYIFWIHMALALTLIASIPFTKLRHLVVTPLNVILHPLRKEGTIEKIENIEEAESLGVDNITDFTSQQLVSFDACVRCGRCEEACPVTFSGMPYSPRTFIQSLREAMITSLVSSNGQTKHALLGEILPETTPWFCTTCGACLKRCPAFVNPVDEIIELRRYQALTTGKVPKSVGDALKNMERQGNPWGVVASDRIAWVEPLGVRELAPGDKTDILLFMGCAAAFDDRNKKAAQVFIRLLQKAGVDFAILGLDETCCGETARRLGNEYLFQVFTQQNIETFSQVEFKRIVTQCPHCYNTLKNEYPQFGGKYDVLHYTEFLGELSLPWEKISQNGHGIQGSVTYHDSCYLGRYNQIYDEPRKLLDKAGVNRVEMPRRGENSFCCGGGGGQMWMETDATTRINHRRLEDVSKARADTVVTACPYCLLMFDDALRSKGLGERIKLMDLSEALATQLEI